MTITRSLAVAAALLGTTSLAHAAPVPVDLSSWTVNGSDSNWVRASDNNSVRQTVNGSPTVFFNGVDSQGLALSGTIEVQTSRDDDFIGFVLGYNTGDLSRSTADYLLVDWKQNRQPEYSACDNSIDGLRGLAISRVTGPLTSQDAWCHNGAVEELQRGATLGDTGWADNTEYEFDLIFTQSYVEVKVDGSTELAIRGDFENGSFGFYNYSQGSVRYAGLTEAEAPPPVVPLPAGLPLLASGLAAFGLAGMRRRKRAG
jgi:hypothetical protein